MRRMRASAREETVTILDEIVAHKRREVERARSVLSADELAERARATADPVRRFRSTLLAAPRPR